MLPAVLGAAEEGGLEFLVLPVNFVKQLLYFVFVFFFLSDSDTVPEKDCGVRKQS